MLLALGDVCCPSFRSRPTVGLSGYGERDLAQLPLPARPARTRGPGALPAASALRLPRKRAFSAGMPAPRLRDAGPSLV